MVDPFLHEVRGWGYQSLQQHQDVAVQRAEAGLELLQAAILAEVTVAEIGAGSPPAPARPHAL